ncbi:MCE family protein [bacterium]|nr:MCE family protein [bacterium]
MKRKQILLVEIIIWLLIIFCGSLFFIYRTTIKDSSQNTYYIFFDDVEGLVKGSPVRLMGINIGHIKDIKIFDNKVFVSILVTKEGVIIPKSATATIEFYGLGGSTSLELNPSTATEDTGKEEIIPSDSYSVQDYWNGSKLSSEVMIVLYDGLRETIDNSGIMHKRELLKQNKKVLNLINGTKEINKTQTVIINKMTKETKDYLQNKNTKQELDEDENGDGI